MFGYVWFLGFRVTFGFTANAVNNVPTSMTIDSITIGENVF